MPTAVVPTDEELLAYLDERLPVNRAAAIEEQIRLRGAVAQRLVSLLAERDQGGRSLGEIWARTRPTCPDRFVWQRYLDGELGAGLANYLDFHLQEIGCRYCQANLADLRQAAGEKSGEKDLAADRRRRIFQSSIGWLPKD